MAHKTYRIGFIHGVNVSQGDLELQAAAAARLVYRVLPGSTVVPCSWGSTGTIVGDITSLPGRGHEALSCLASDADGCDLLIAHSMGSALACRLRDRSGETLPTLHIGSPVSNRVYGALIDVFAFDLARPIYRRGYEIWNEDDIVASHWVLGRRVVPFHRSRRIAIPGDRPIGEHSVFRYLEHPLTASALLAVTEFT